ncbi:hypothetical protein ACFL1H_07590 [Nanoarchaeota archaeon]
MEITPYGTSPIIVGQRFDSRNIPKSVPENSKDTFTSSKVSPYDVVAGAAFPTFESVLNKILDTINVDYRVNETSEQDGQMSDDYRG